VAGLSAAARGSADWRGVRLLEVGMRVLAFPIAEVKLTVVEVLC
jgi:hypothetical protein